MHSAKDCMYFGEVDSYGVMREFPIEHNGFVKLE